MLVQTDRKRKELDIDCGVISVARTKRRRVLRSDDEPTGRHYDEFTAVVSFLPKKRKSSKTFTFSVHQRAFTNGVFSSIPGLCINNILPADSRIFTVVKQGNMVELQQMLRGGKASMRDYDEDGASLLFVRSLHIDSNWVHPSLVSNNV